MKIYKRSLWELVKGLILAPFGAFVVYLIADYFIDSPLPVYGITGLVFLVMVTISILSENIYFELYDNGELRYYKRRKLKHRFDLSGCRVGYRRRSQSGLLGNHDIQLQIINDEAENSKKAETLIDCSPLGSGRFEKMFDQIQKHAKGDKEEEIMRAIPVE